MNNKHIAKLIPMLFIVNGALASSLNEEMERTFNSMTNVTTPKAYNTARRGVLSAGQLFIRNDTKRVSLITTTAPSYSMGCGGISIFGGSLSILSKDEFIQTFQAIGSNALGYGVKLAITSACATCESIMTSLEKTAQAINKLNIDSCQAAQGVVQAGADFAGISQAESKAATTNTSSGIMADFADAWSWGETTSQSNTNKMKESNPTQYSQEITGNITWRALIENDLKGTYGGDDTLLEVFQSIVGTAIVVDNDTESESKETSPSLELRKGHKIKLENLIDGGILMVYQCDTYDADGCLKPSKTATKEIEIIGIKSRLDEILKGDNGLIQNLMGNDEWSEESKKFLGLATVFGQICLRKLRSAVAVGEIGIAEYIADLCSARMSMEMARSTVMSYFEEIHLTIIASKNSGKIEATKMLQMSKTLFLEEYNKLSGQVSTDLLIQELDAVTDSMKASRKISDQ